MPAGPTLWLCQNWRKLTNVCKKTGQSPEDHTDSRSPCESSDWGVTLKYKGNKLCLPMKELSVFGGVQTPDPSKNQMFVWKNCQRTASSLEGSSGFENHQCRVHIPDRYPEVLSLGKERTAQQWLVKALLRGPYKNKGVMWGRVEHSHSSALVLQTFSLPEGRRVSLKVDYTTKLKVGKMIQ